jgi:echinoid protein
MSSDGHYEISTTTDNSNNDVYISTLRINNLRHQDYGDYFCRVANSLDSIRPGIRLQPKGKPERPYNLKAEDVGSNFVSLVWDPGFDGGIASTKFFVNYRKVPMIHNSEMNGDCGIVMPTSHEWMEYDCHKDVPCSITPLDQHQSYVFRVKAKNSMGDSEYSNEIGTTTKVSRIPMPSHVAFDPATKLLVVNVGATCLSLMAVVESIGFNDSPLSSWQEVERLHLTVSGSKPTYREEILDNMIPATRRSSARSLGDDDLPLALEEEIQPRVRVKLCLKVNKDHCGEYTEAESKYSQIGD